MFWIIYLISLIICIRATKKVFKDEFASGYPARKSIPTLGNYLSSPAVWIATFVSLVPGMNFVGAVAYYAAIGLVKISKSNWITKLMSRPL